MKGPVTASFVHLASLRLSHVLNMFKGTHSQIISAIGVLPVLPKTNHLNKLTLWWWKYCWLVQPNKFFPMCLAIELDPIVLIHESFKDPVLRMTTIIIISRVSSAMTHFPVTLRSHKISMNSRYSSFGNGWTIKTNSAIRNAPRINAPRSHWNNTSITNVSVTVPRQKRNNAFKRCIFLKSDSHAAPRRFATEKTRDSPSSWVGLDWPSGFVLRPSRTLSVCRSINS
jgi:hypothetical protein